LCLAGETTSVSPDAIERPRALRLCEKTRGKLSATDVALWFKNSGAESNFYWYVTFMCAIAFVASILMPDPKIKGYLQGEGTEI